MAASSGKPTQPGGACNGTAAEPSSTVEQELYDYQMHTKMCKKIAQLTKVIYSLNTKNEEQEATLQSLRRVATETQGGLQPTTDLDEQGEESAFALRTRLLELQATVEEAEEREHRAVEEFEDRVAVLTQETQELRRDYESQLLNLQTERDAAQNLLEQTTEENKRLQEDCQHLLQTRDEERRTREDEDRKKMEERRKVEEECEEKMRGLKEELEALMKEKERMEEERRKDEEMWKRRVREVEQARQQEQDAARRCLQESLSEHINQWQQREQDNRKSQNATLLQKLQKVESELEIREQRLTESNRHCCKLQERVEDLEEQMEEGRRRVVEAEGVATKAEEELAVAKERLLLQENELQNKSEELLSQSSCQVRVCAEVEDLRSQLSRLNIRNKELELQNSGRTNDHARMLKQHADSLASIRSELQRAHVEEVRRVQQEVERERQSERQETEEERRRGQEKLEEERSRLKEQLKRALEEVMRKHSSELRHTHTTLDTERARAQKADELRKTSEEERRSLEMEREELRKQLQTSITEISRLEEVIQQLEGERAEEREREEERAREQEKRERECLARHVQQPVCGPECARLREEVEHKHAAMQLLQEEMGLQRESLQTEITALQKEREILEQSQLSLREKLRAQYEQQLSDHVEGLQREREEEIRDVNHHWQHRVQELQAQLEERMQVGKGNGEQEKEECHGNGEMDRMKQEIQRTREMNSSLRAQLHSTVQEKERLMKKQQLQVVKEEEEEEEGVKADGERDVDRDNSGWHEREEELLRVERLSHQRALQSLEAQAQEDLQSERQRLLTQHRLQLEKQKAELTQQHTEWVRQVTQRHMQQIEDLQTELHTHTQMMALQQDLKQQNRVQSLERQLDERGSEVQTLRREKDELQERVDALSTPRERRQDSHISSWFEGKDEAGEAEEEEERSTRERALGEMAVLRKGHRTEIQTIISDFSAAQTRLQARIVALETELSERKREPRVEDLHAIAKLQDKLTDRDQLIKRLVGERHQLSQHPPVCSDGTLKPYDTRTRPGSLTPTLKKKPLEDSPPRVTSVPNLSAYERSLRSAEGGAGGVEPAGRGLPRTHTPPTTTQAPSTNPDVRAGIRYTSHSPTQELPQSHLTYSQLIRNPSAQRVIETGPDGQDPQRQEWFTKYFSF